MFKKIKCNRCGEVLDLKDFYLSNKRKCGYLQPCKKCRIKYTDKYHKKNLNRSSYHKKYRENLSKKFGINWGSFHSRATQYIKYHHLYPEFCPICGCSKKIKVHHPFYRSNDDRHLIVFCCNDCHKDIHSGKKQCPKYIDLFIYKQTHG